MNYLIEASPLEVISIPLNNSKLYTVQRWIKKLPGGWVLRRSIMRLFKKAMKSYNIKRHNLPTKFPDDFEFIRTGTTYQNNKKYVNDLSISAHEVTFTKGEFNYARNIHSSKMEYVLQKEQKKTNPVGIGETEKLYLLLRETGFLHFDVQDIHVSFDLHTTTVYSLTAHEKKYVFVDATDTPIDELWSENFERIDTLINTFPGI